MDTKLHQYLLKIEESLLHKIITDLRDEKMILGEAKYLAKDFLALLPVKNKGELLEKLYILRQRYPQVREIFGKYFGEFEEEKTTQKLAILRMFLKNGKYEQALNAIQEVDYHG